MKLPTYTPRDLLAFENADRVVARIRINREWKEQEFYPVSGQTVREKLAEVQHALRHNRDFSSIALYVGGFHNGERMIASVRHDHLPEELRR
jgi:hypothetical protein